MKYYYGNSYKEALSNEPVEIKTTKNLKEYEECYSFVIPVNEYNDEEDYDDCDEEDKDFFRFIKDSIFFKVERYKSIEALEDDQPCSSSKVFNNFTQAKKYYLEKTKTCKTGYIILVWLTNDGDPWFHILEEQDCSNKTED